MIEGLKRRYFVLTASGCFSQLMLFGVGSMYQIPYFFRADNSLLPDPQWIAKID